MKRKPFIFRNCLVGIPFSCSSLLDKVAEIQKNKVNELCKVAFKDDTDGSVEIYFFLHNNENIGSNTNILFTSTYVNPIATNELLIMLLSDTNDLDSIGFIGILSNDNEMSVERNIKKAFQIFKKRLSIAENRVKAVNNINMMTFEQVMEKFFSDNHEEILPSQPPLLKQPEGRVLRPRRPKPDVVDLTSVLEETFVDEKPASEIFCLCCSEIMESEDSSSDSSCTCCEVRDEQRCERKRFLKKSYDPIGLERWLDIYDFSEYPDDHDEEHPVDLRSLNEMGEDLNDLLKKSRKQGELEHRQAVESAEEDSDKHASTSSLKQTNAFEFYKDKSARDRGEGSSSMAQKSYSQFPEPKLGRGLSPNHNLHFEIKVPKKRLLDTDDYKKYESKKGKLNSDDSKSLGRIPWKFSRSPDRKISSSVIERSPPPPQDKIKGRPPIRQFSSGLRESTRPTRSQEILLKALKMPTASSPPYDPRNHAFKPQKSSMEAASSAADKAEVINVEDYPERSVQDSVVNGENSDMNNNGKRTTKRKLLDLPPEPTPVNRIFKTKKHSKSEHGGGSR